MRGIKNFNIKTLEKRFNIKSVEIIPDSSLAADAVIISSLPKTFYFSVRNSKSEAQNPKQ